MDSSNIKKIQLPSKRFLQRGGIALGIVIVILIGQTSWFQGFFQKKAKQPSTDTRTVAEIVDADTNGNSIPDWQERLWGLDPTVLYTNGVSNRELIEQKRRALGISASIDQNTPLTKTDRLARELFALSQSLGTDTNDETINAIAQSVSGSVEIRRIANKYSLSNIRTVPTTPESLRKYKIDVEIASKKLDANAPGMDIVIDALKNGDYTEIDSLSTSITAYVNQANVFKQIAVPNGLSLYHVDLMNGLAGMAESFIYLKQINTDSMEALSGISLYQNHHRMFLTAIDNTNAYLKKYGIL